MTRIGVTGHMNITADSVPLVYAQIARLLAEAGDPAELVGVSCIARGADSVFAQAVLDAGGRLEVVLPSRNYRERKVKPDHAEQFDDLVSRADNVRVMEFDDAGREAYEAANEAVVGTCDRLIAVWDGKPSEQGGTGTVVELARDRNLPVDIVWPEGAVRG
ncbi:hypothetical protein D7D52_14830 [Nocardia yunnanensis]|uniref:DUF1273 family protein n=1 Tax=Nocardia yunnanensis TaxID=2382165 RepID=A0A386ZN74_9NOCA|nr:hypothetical protein [Nocardia yunnanensis]AYF79047.1 hypothetical protein D7D52_14830 [Nocardia yunnanensis]